MSGSFRQIIDKAVAEKRFLVVPGAHDALSARLIQKIGFETYFIGGFPAVGSRYGVPDVGLKGFGEISAAVRDIMGACDLPVFVEAPRSVAELERIGKAFDVPQICNPLMGGHTPILTMEEMGQLGFDCAVLGLDTLMHAAKAVEAVLLDMKSGQFARRNDGMDFEDYKRTVGFDKWAGIDERFGAS